LRLLIDTSVFLAYTFEPERIAPEWTAAIDEADQAFLSTSSVWEIVIKHRKGKLPLPGDATSFISGGMDRLQLMPLDVTARHALATVGLPMHHQDPFDRMLIAQAICERLTIVTIDKIIPSYDVPVFGHKPRKTKRS